MGFSWPLASPALFLMVAKYSFLRVPQTGYNQPFASTKGSVLPVLAATSFMLRLQWTSRRPLRLFSNSRLFY